MLQTNVFALADALQVELRIYKAGAMFEIRGGRDFKFPVSSKASTDADIVVPLKVVGSYLATTEANILVHIRKDLYAYVQCTQGITATEDLLQVNLVDISATTIKNLLKMVDGMPSHTAMMAITPLTKAAFYKQVRAIEWLPMPK